MFQLISFAAATSSRRVLFRCADISLLGRQFSYRYKGYVAGLEPGCEKARQSEKHEHEKINKYMVQLEESHGVSASESSTATLVTANTPKNAELLKYDENLKVGHCCVDVYNDSVQPSTLVKDEITQGTSTTVCKDGESQCSDSVPAEPAEKKPTSSGYSVDVLRTKKSALSIVILDEEDPTKCYRFRVLRYLLETVGLVCGVCRSMYDAAIKKKTAHLPSYVYKLDHPMEDFMLNHFPECKKLNVEDVLKDYQFVENFKFKTTGQSFKMYRRFKDYSFLLRLKHNMCYRFYRCYGFDVECYGCRKVYDETDVRRRPRWKTRSDGNSIQIINPLSGHLDGCNSIPYCTVMKKYQHVDHGTAQRFFEDWYNHLLKYDKFREVDERTQHTDKQRYLAKKKAKPSS